MRQSRTLAIFDGAEVWKANLNTVMASEEMAALPWL